MKAAKQLQTKQAEENHAKPKSGDYSNRLTTKLVTSEMNLLAHEDKLRTSIKGGTT
jgi:hypothetical protein